MTDPDIVVLGAGLAGLSAATTLADAGRRVLVLEARPTLGGRAASYRDPATGELVDNGQHILLGCYRETLAFLGRLGVHGKLRRQSGLSVDVVDRLGHRTTFRLPPLPAPLHLAAGVAAWGALSWRERLSIAPLVRPLQQAIRRLRAGEPIAPEAEQETVRQWLERHQQAPRLIEVLWEPLAVAALNQPIEQAAAAHFVAVLARMFGEDAEAAAIYLPTVGLSELYAEPARARLERAGSHVRVHAAGRVIVEDGRVAGVAIRDEVVPAAAVILAVPWLALRESFLTPPAEMETVFADAEATPASPIVTVNLWFDRTLPIGPLLGLPGRTFQWIFDKQVVFDGAGTHLSLVSSGAEAIVRQSNDELIATALRETREALPEARGAGLRRATAVRERFSTFSLAPGLPRRPGTRTAIDGLFLAGDWVETGFPATIESAVISGHRAAAAVLRSAVPHPPHPQA